MELTESDTPLSIAEDPIVVSKGPLRVLCAAVATQGTTKGAAHTAPDAHHSVMDDDRPAAAADDGEAIT